VTIDFYGECWPHIQKNIITNNVQEENIMISALRLWVCRIRSWYPCVPLWKDWAQKLSWPCIPIPIKTDVSNCYVFVESVMNKIHWNKHVFNLVPFEIFTTREKIENVCMVQFFKGKSSGWKREGKKEECPIHLYWFPIWEMQDLRETFVFPLFIFQNRQAEPTISHRKESQTLKANKIETNSRKNNDDKMRKMII